MQLIVIKGSHTSEKMQNIGSLRFPKLNGNRKKKYITRMKDIMMLVKSKKPDDMDHESLVGF